MYVNKCTKCGKEFETKNPKRVICPDCLYPDKKTSTPSNTEENISRTSTLQPQLTGTTPTPETEDRPVQQNFYNSYSAGESQSPRPSYRNYHQDGGNNGGYHSQGGYNRPQGGYDRPQGGYNRPQQGGYSRPQGGYDRPQGGYNRPQQGGYSRPQGGYDRPQGGDNRPQQGGYSRPQGGYDRPQGGYNRPQQGGYSRPQGGYNNRPQGGYDRPQGGYNNRPQQGGFSRPQGGFNRAGGGNFNRRPPMQKRNNKPLLVSKEQMEQIEVLYKALLPLPNPDVHEVIGEKIGLEPKKVFFGINLIRQKMMLPKLPFPKRKLAISPDQLFAIQNLYEPLLPLPPIGCHKIIAAQLKMDEWRVHVGIGLIRAKLGLERWNQDRADAPEEFKKQKAEEEKAKTKAEKTSKKSEKTEKAEKPDKPEKVKKETKKTTKTKAKKSEKTEEEAEE